MFKVPAAALLTDKQLRTEIARNDAEFCHRINTPQNTAENNGSHRDLCQIKWLYLTNLQTVRGQAAA